MEISDLAPRFLPLEGEDWEQMAQRRGVSYEGREIALMPTAEFKGRDDRLCMAKDDTCNAYRAKDKETGELSSLCFGHLRGQKKN